MGVACEVRRKLADHPEKIQPRDFKIDFIFHKPGDEPKKSILSPEERSANARARALIRVGGRVVALDGTPLGPDFKPLPKPVSKTNA